MSVDEHSSYKLTSSKDPADCPPGALQTMWDSDAGLHYDFVTQIANKTCLSFRPIHDFILSQEHTRVGQALWALKCSSAVPLAFKTDSILFRPQKRTQPKLDYTYANVHRIRAQEPRGIKPLTQRHELTVAKSDQLIFRTYAAEQRDLLTYRPRLPACSYAMAEAKHEWTRVESIEDINTGLLIIGPPGTGKSYNCLRLIDRLRSQGGTVEILSKTHVASQRVGGQTCDQFLRRRVARGNVRGIDWVFVDEISQADIGIWTQLASLLRLSSPPSSYWRVTVINFNP